MSHHASGQNFAFPRGDARLDMTDLYAFTNPKEPGKSILILNVHPSVDLNPPGPRTKEPFAPGALYEFKIDTNGDAVADLCYSLEFRSRDDEILDEFVLFSIAQPEIEDVVVVVDDLEQRPESTLVENPPCLTGCRPLRTNALI